MAQPKIAQLLDDEENFLQSTAGHRLNAPDCVGIFNTQIAEPADAESLQNRERAHDAIAPLTKTDTEGLKMHADAYIALHREMLPLTPEAR